MQEEIKTGLMFEDLESQNEAGEIIRQEQKRKEAKTAQYWADSFTNSIRMKQEETNNVQASMNAYIAINNRQWDGNSVNTLLGQGRPVNTYNFIKPNIDKVYGQIVMNPNSVIFTPMNQKDNAGKNIVQSLYEYDYERGNWEKEKHRFYKDTLIHTGVLEMYKDYTHSKLGNVGLRALNRFSDIVLDPFWNTDKVSDCKYYIKSKWMTDRQLKDKFRLKNEEIEAGIREAEALRGSIDYEETLEELSINNTEFYDEQKKRYRVLEVVYMQEIPYEKTYSKKLKRIMKENELPDVKRTENGTIVDSKEYVKLTEYENVCKVMTVAPAVGLGLILQEGEHPIQVGKLPIYVASSDNTMGVRQGLVTGMVDAQMSLNKTKSMILGGQITAANGGLLVKEGLFKNNAEFERFTKERTIPGRVFKVDDNAKLSDAITTIPVGNEPKGLEQQLDWTERFLEKYTNSTAAISGRSEGANESGTLFESKKQQSQVAHVGIVEIFAQVDKEIAEDYFFTCKKMYAEKYRSFTNARTGDQFEINKDMNAQDPEVQNGQFNRYLANADEQGYFKINEIAKLPRHDVVIKRSELGLDNKQRSLSIYNEMMQRSINPIMKSLYEKAMIPLMDIPEQSIKQMETAADIFVELQIAQTKSQIQAMNDQAVQSQINTQMLMAQAGQQAQMGQQMQVQPPGDARTAANGPGQGNMPQGLAEESSGANNQSNSDV